MWFGGCQRWHESESEKVRARERERETEMEREKEREREVNCVENAIHMHMTNAMHCAIVTIQMQFVSMWQ